MGFGCGDQVLRWREHFGVREIDGLNLSHSQTAFARERTAQHGHADLAPRLHVGDARSLGAWARQTGVAPDTVLALDCAYHFPSRADFLAAACQLLPPGGRIGLTDLVLARDSLHPLRERLPLRVIAGASHIPHANLVTESDYRAHWTRAGIQVETFHDLTPQVFQPFGDWLRRYGAGLDPAAARSVRWGKFTAVARFLAWAQTRGVLRYVLCTGRKI